MRERVRRQLAGCQSPSSGDRLRSPGRRHRLPREEAPGIACCITDSSGMTCSARTQGPAATPARWLTGCSEMLSGRSKKPMAPTPSGRGARHLGFGREVLRDDAIRPNADDGPMPACWRTPWHCEPPASTIGTRAHRLLREEARGSATGKRDHAGLPAGHLEPIGCGSFARFAGQGFRIPWEASLCTDE
jgi:hypothetical protein